MEQEPKKFKEFIDGNKEPLQELKRLMKQADTVVGVTKLQDVLGRQQAINIINQWLAKIWGISYDDLPEPEEDEELIRTI